MNPLVQHIRSHIVGRLCLKQYMQDHGYPVEIAGIILEMACELITWTVSCLPDHVYFVVGNDLFAWGRIVQESKSVMLLTQIIHSPYRILDDERRKFMLTAIKNIKDDYVYRSILIYCNIVLSGDGDEYISLCEMSVPNVRRIFLGYYTAFVVTQSGNVYDCGRNGYGQLGFKGDFVEKSPVKINFPDESTKIVKIACGITHTLFLTETGTIYGCGCNGFGQLGTGNQTEFFSIPTHVGWPSGEVMPHVIDIYCGDYYSLAITIDGNIYTWGCNDTGQLGLGDTLIQCRPKLVQFP